MCTGQMIVLGKWDLISNDLVGHPVLKKDNNQEYGIDILNTLQLPSEQNILCRGTENQFLFLSGDTLQMEMIQGCNPNYAVL